MLCTGYSFTCNYVFSIIVYLGYIQYSRPKLFHNVVYIYNGAVSWPEAFSACQFYIMSFLGAAGALGVEVY